MRLAWGLMHWNNRNGCVARDSFPSLGQIVADQTAVMTTQAAEEFVATSYRERLH